MTRPDFSSMTAAQLAAWSDGYYARTVSRRDAAIADGSLRLVEHTADGALTWSYNRDGRLVRCFVPEAK